MKRLLLLLTFAASAQPNLKTVYELGNGNQGATYEECLAFYQLLDNQFTTISLLTLGFDDTGIPLHLAVYDPASTFEFNGNKAVVLINNGIHPGEPDGIDATMMLFRDLANGKIKPPQNTLIAAIPVYNIGGALNRSSTSRVNQNGPERYGFRGNARNYDLNRDFIKQDTKNTMGFAEIFRLTNPEVFIDNHVSNGADYQYTLTYIMTQHNKLGGPLGDFLKHKMMPALVTDLQKKKIESTPYVNAWGHTPDKGFAQFYETPRYATGYTSLFNTIGFVVETHMLKPYPDRVKATYEFMLSTVRFTDLNFKEIKLRREQNNQLVKAGDNYAVRWTIDSSKVEQMTFLGYEGLRKKSDVTSGDRLFYDRKKPFSKLIPFYSEYKPAAQVAVPKAYVIPQEFWDVIALLKHNGMAYRQLERDTTLLVEQYHIADYTKSTTAYEGHYPHTNTKVSRSVQTIGFKKGDYLFATDQPGVKYLLETLEPEAVDSFFNWNFFDTILQQKEWYSDYVFEDLAADFLRNHPAVKAEFDRKMTEVEFAANPGAQLYWIYTQTPHYEKEHLRYPVYRIH